MKLLEQFSIECRKTKTKTKTKVITLANHNKHRQFSEPIKTQSKCSRHEARENVRARVTIGFGFTSDWLRKWREIFKPITKRSNSKPKQTQLTFDTQVKTALSRDITKHIVQEKKCSQLTNLYHLIYLCGVRYLFYKDPFHKRPLKSQASQQVRALQLWKTRVYLVNNILVYKLR